jgi:transposase
MLCRKDFHHHFEALKGRQMKAQVSLSRFLGQVGVSCEHPNMEENDKTKKRTRHKYTAEFKAQTVAHVRQHGGDLTRTAAELGVNYWTLRDWMEAAEQKEKPKANNPSELEAENRRLKAELERVTEQRDILKKSLGILSTT